LSGCSHGMLEPSISVDGREYRRFDRVERMPHNWRPMSGRRAWALLAGFFLGVLQDF
jgi:hypothetical protein